MSKPDHNPANAGSANAAESNADESNADEPNAERRVEITAADLPLHCPMPGKRTWDSHPKVYLPIEKGGEKDEGEGAEKGSETSGDITREQICPYCGTRYVLIGKVESSH